MAYTIDGGYKPFTFQELVTPYMLYKDAYDKQEAKLDELYDKASVFSDLDDLPEDSQARKIYDNYMSSLNAANKDFATNGLTMNNRGLYSDIRRRYQGEIGRLAQAKTKVDELNKMRMTQSMQDPSMIYSQSNFGIDDFIGKNKPNTYGISGKYLYDLGSKAGTTASSRIWSDVNVKNTANKYFLLASQTNGYTPEMLARMRDDFMAIPEFRKEVENAMKANGVTQNLTGDKYTQAALNYVNGFVDSCTYKRNDNLQQNPGVLNAAQDEQKRQFNVSKAMQEEQFNAQAQMKGFIQQADKSYKYDSSKDPELQKAIEVAKIKAQAGGNKTGVNRDKISQAKGYFYIKYNPKTNKHTVTFGKKGFAQGSGVAKGAQLSSFDSLNSQLQNIINKSIVQNGDPTWYTYMISEDGNEVWISPGSIITSYGSNNTEEDDETMDNASNPTGQSQTGSKGNNQI